MTVKELINGKNCYDAMKDNFESQYPDLFLGLEISVAGYGVEKTYNNYRFEEHLPPHICNIIMKALQYMRHVKLS